MGMWSDWIGLYQELQQRFAMKVILRDFIFLTVTVLLAFGQTQCSHDRARQFCSAHPASAHSGVCSLCQQTGNVLRWLP